MSNVKIQTLTAVHIGSGETLQYGTDFVQGLTDNDYVLSVIDPRKVLALIGENNIHQWVASIERKEATSAVVKRFAPHAQISDYSQRLIMEWSAAKPTDTLKEHIHDGQGRPYIPGSSLKGAIRTCVLASIANEKNGLEKNIQNSYGKVSAKIIESDLFGSDPNKDVFRFMQIGDAYFGQMREVAVRMVNINERERRGFWDESKPQLIEAIPPEDETEFHMKLNIEGYNISKPKVHNLPMCMLSEESLFKTINAHTLNLLEGEIAYWEEREQDDDTQKVSLYMEKISDIASIVKECVDGKECVLRVGHGSGWRFITGAWAENLDNFSSVVVPSSRPKNFKYEQYDFPKTRRVDDECELLGFVKLSR